MDAWAVWTYTGKLWRNGVDQLEALGTVWLEYRDLTTQAVQKGRSARPQASRNRRRTLWGTLRISMS
jgi:hypothetical protein